MTTFADIVLAVANMLLPLKGDVLRGRRDQRERLATYLESISLCLDDMADDFKVFKRPTRSCAQLEVHLANLERILSRGPLQQKEAIELLDRLRRAGLGPASILVLIRRTELGLIADLEDSSNLERLGRIALETLGERGGRRFKIGLPSRPTLGTLSIAERSQFAKELAKIEVAAGIFKAVADVVRVDTSYRGLMRRVKGATKPAMEVSARLLAVLAALCLSLMALLPYADKLLMVTQPTSQRWILVPLLMAITAGSVIHVRLFSVSKRGLPNVYAVLATNCDALAPANRSLCIKLKEEVTKLEAAGRLRTPWGGVKVLCVDVLGLAGIIYSLAIPGMWVAAVAGLPGVLIWVGDLRRQNRLQVQYLKRWVEDVAALWEIFKVRSSYADPLEE